VEKVEVSSPVVPPAGKIPARYTCDGANTWPELRIKGIPSNTRELVLDVIKLAPVDNKLVFSWAVAGLDPKLRSISAGKLPLGAVVGVNEKGRTGYDLCPPHKTKEEYAIVLYALPRALHPKPGFDPTKLRFEAVHDAEYEGLFVFTYPRR
jgi:phosphatidylethanolamine-binding protein (PEBP) family uncharacterized protein